MLPQFFSDRLTNPPSQVRVLLYLLLIPSSIFILIPPLAGLPPNLTFLPYITFILISVAIFLRNIESTRNISRALLFTNISIIAFSSFGIDRPLGLFFQFWWLMLPVVGMISIYYPYGMFIGLILCIASLIFTSPLPLIVLFLIPLLWLFICYFVSETATLKIFRQQSEANVMKDEFIAFASHQLRTPLAAMKWFSEMLLDGEAGKLSKEQKIFIQKIYLSNQRMVELVNTLLHISRIESGRIGHNLRSIDLGQLIQEIVTEIKPKSEEKNQKLHIDLPSQLPKIQSDPSLIREVISNLITNSIKYTPQKGTINIQVRQNNSEITFQISDSGYGIPQTQKKQIFQKFFRADNISSQESEGTGLGLYLAWLIVQSWGGRIWFDSTEGKGTTFWVTLPKKVIQ